MTVVRTHFIIFEDLIKRCINDSLDQNEIRSLIQKNKQGLTNILNTMTSTDSQEDMTEHVLEFVLQYTKNKTIWNRPYFKQLYENFVSFLSEGIKQTHYFTPLHNLDTKIGDFEISNDVKIRKITENEKEQINNKHSNFVPVKSLLQTLKHILVIKIDRDTAEPVETAKQKIRDTISTLRIIKSGDVKGGGMYRFIRSEKWNPNEMFKVIEYEPTRLYSSNKYVLTLRDKRNIKWFFTPVSKKSHEDDYEYLNRSIRRFNDAIERERPAEKILDFVISIDNLLGTAGNEATLKLCQRVTTLLAKNDKEMIEYFNFFKMCYNVRNGLVHESKQRRYKVDDTGCMSEKDVVMQLENLNRELIRKMIKFIRIQAYKNMSHSESIKTIDKFLLDRRLLKKFNSAA